MGESMTWESIPEKAPRNRVSRPERCVEFEVTTKAKLKSHSKEALIEEVQRLQTAIREVAIELGIARRAKSSEYAIAIHFAGNIIALIKAAWSNNI